MKRLISFILIMALAVCLSACNKNDDSSRTTAASSEETSSLSEPTSSEEGSSEEDSSETPISSSEEPSSSVPSTPAPPTPPPPSVATVGWYTVNDPQNTRGISNVKSGFGFGVAKNGQAHSISVNNQARFDSMSGIEALALDTVSADKRMYLTFDCGYEYQNLTADILDTLKEKDVKAAFFVTLSYIKSNPEIVRRMIDEGHIVGNHSATHPVFPDISRTTMAEELYLVDEYLQNNFGYKNKYFRFPTGANSENSLELVTSVGYKSIFWSLAYADYDTANQVGYDKAFETVTGRFHSGAVILLHAVSQDNADILAAVIDKAHAEGYTFKTLDDYYG